MNSSLSSAESRDINGPRLLCSFSGPDCEGSSGRVRGGPGAAMEGQQGTKEEHWIESLETLTHDLVSSLASGFGKVTPPLCSWFLYLIDSLSGKIERSSE